MKIENKREYIKPQLKIYGRLIDVVKKPSSKGIGPAENLSTKAH